MVISGRSQEMSRGIGLLNEKPLHAALKEWYAQPEDRFEVSVDGFVCVGMIVAWRWEGLDGIDQSTGQSHRLARVGGGLSGRLGSLPLGRRFAPAFVRNAGRLSAGTLGGAERRSNPYR